MEPDKRYESMTNPPDEDESNGDDDDESVFPKKVRSADEIRRHQERIEEKRKEIRKQETVEAWRKRIGEPEDSKKKP